MSNLTPPVTIQQFKDFFNRGFNYGKGKDTVMDQDIQNAFDTSMVVYDSSLWSSDPARVAFKLLAAHHLAVVVQAEGGLSLKQGSKGGVKSRGSGVTASKSVGGVTINYAVCQKAVDDPVLNQYLQTEYGKAYLTLISPHMVGRLFTASGPSDPSTGFPPLIGESQ